jgi:hypothetical protein
MAESPRRSAPDPLGKRALFWVPSDGGPGGDGRGGSTEPRPATNATIALPVGKRALYSGARAGAHSVRETSDNPLVDRGSLTIECERCRQTSHIGLLDLVIYQFPFAGWLPRGRFDRRITCPSCRKRSWCSVTLRKT